MYQIKSDNLSNVPDNLRELFGQVYLREELAIEMKKYIEDTVGMKCEVKELTTA